jgi:hypothetical protein
MYIYYMYTYTAYMCIYTYISVIKDEHLKISVKLN